MSLVAGLRVDVYTGGFADAADVFNDENDAVGALPTATYADLPAANEDPRWGSGEVAVRFGGSLIAPTSGTHSFRVRGDDGVRLWLDNELIYDDWDADRTGRLGGVSLQVAAGRHDLRLDYHDADGGGDGERSVALEWKQPGGDWEPLAEDLLTVDRMPSVIDRAGIYVGSYFSNDPFTPAVLINTDRPVRIERSTITSHSHLIATGNPFSNADFTADVDLEVRDNTGVGLNPNVRGQTAGRFVYATNAARLNIEQNTLISTSGIWAASSDNMEFRVVANDVLNIDGRVSDGNGGYDGFERRSFVQLDKVVAPGAEIAWNRVTNLPGESRVEDNINLFRSGGTAGDPIRIHRNLIDGAWPIEGEEFFGGGILVGDNPDVGGHSRDAAHAEVFRNVVLNTTNHGIAIAGGAHHRVYDNRVFSDGRTPDGTKVLQDNDVGVYVWNSYGDDTWADNAAWNNVIGVIRHDPAGVARRNDDWMPDGLDFGGNVYADVNETTESNERLAWETYVARSGITVGVR
ncbi:MAG: PA14 domain-containing protein [Planctomycetota bacterium]